MKILPVVSCPACGSESSTPIDYGTADLRLCLGCGVTHAAEMVDPSELYVEGYMTGGSEFGPPDTTDPTFQRYLLHFGGRRLDAIGRWVGQVGPLLDVGCGTGDVLAAAKNRGIEAVGVEPVEESARIASARGVDVRQALLEESGLPESSFRTVTAFHVLEHMSDAVGFLRLIARWAQPGGHVVVEVPNWRSIERRMKGVEWPGIRPLEHVAHYGPKTLAATLERAGLVDVRVRTLTSQWVDSNLRFALGDLGLRRLYRSRLSRPLSVERVVGDQVDRYPRAPLRWAIQGAARMYDFAKVGQVVLAAGRRPAR